MTMTTKLLELRDRATFIPVLAVACQSPDSADERYLLRRAGYVSEDPAYPSIMLIDLHGGRRAECDSYAWGDRTFQVAHQHIVKHWHELVSGDVVDVEHILGETTRAKASERDE